MIAIGIDPGKAGGIAIIDADGTARAVKMPDTERDLLDVLEAFRPVGGIPSARACIERVGAFPGMGVVSAFTFGRGFGSLLMALTASRIPFDLVQPLKWQTALGCRTGGDKNISKRRAQQLFPSLTISHATADALLIAEYCRRIHGQEGSKESPRD